MVTKISSVALAVSGALLAVSGALLVVACGGGGERI